LESGIHKSKKISSSNTASKKRNKNFPSVEIYTTVISSVGYDYDNLNNVHRNDPKHQLGASKMSLLVIVILFNK